MVRSFAVAAPLPRSADLAIAVPVLLLLSPLLVLTFALLLIVRANSGRWAVGVEGFLYRSGLSDLPFLFDLLTGRASLFARLGETVDAAKANDTPDVLAQSDPAPKVRPLTGGLSGSGFELLGINLRATFIAEGSAEFDELLAALDRSQRA